MGASLRMKLLRGFVFLNVAIVLTNVGAYAYQLLASRGLSVSDYGAWSVMFSFTLIAFIPGAGLNLVLARRVAELNVRGGPHLRDYVYATYRRLAIYLVFGGILLVALSFPVGHYLLAATPYIAILLMCFTTIIMTLLPLPLGILQGVEHYEWLGVVQALRAGLTLVVGAGLTFIGAGLIGIVLGAGLGSLGSVVVGLYLVQRALRRRPAHAAPGEPPVPDASDNYLLVTGTLALTTLMFYADTLVSRRFLGPETAGYYGVIAVAARTVYYAPLAPLTLVVPRVAARVAQGRDTRPLLLAGLALTLALIVPIIGAFALAPRLFLGLLFGPVYGDSPVAELLPWYALAVGLLTVSTFLVYYFMACRRLIYIGGLVAGLVVLFASIAIAHDTAADLVRAIFLGNAVSALLLTVLAILTSFRQRHGIAVSDDVATTPTAAEQRQSD
jgi:O-antigen/teichoic acid export membrane protein